MAWTKCTEPMYAVRSVILFLVWLGPLSYQEIFRGRHLTFADCLVRISKLCEALGAKGQYKPTYYENWINYQSHFGHRYFQCNCVPKMLTLGDKAFCKSNISSGHQNRKYISSIVCDWMIHTRFSDIHVSGHAQKPETRVAGSSHGSSSQVHTALLQACCTCSL